MSAVGYWLATGFGDCPELVLLGGARPIRAGLSQGLPNPLRYRQALAPGDLLNLPVLVFVLAGLEVAWSC